jgi:hypothetical protein
MMNFKFFHRQLEINFWNTVIPLMKESPPVRFILMSGYVLLQEFRSANNLMLSLLVGATGVLIGFSLGVLIKLVQ